MHNKYATFVLPVLAGLAIVGAGFSTWVFNENQTDTGTLSGKISITDVASDLDATLALKAGDASVNEFTLTLDQGGYDNLNNASVGISASVTDIGFTWTVGAAEVAGRSGYAVQLDYYWSLAMSETLGKYVKLNDIDAGESATSFNVGKKIVNFPESTDGDFVITVNSNVGTTDVLLGNTWSYVEGFKPTNFGSYSSMRSALLNETLTLTLTVTATIIPAVEA